MDKTGFIASAALGLLMMVGAVVLWGMPMNGMALLAYAVFLMACAQLWSIPSRKAKK